MNPESQNDTAALIKGVLLTHLILLLHLVIIALLGLMVIFFGGISRYLTWILIGGLLVAVLAAYFVFRYVRARSKQALRNMENSPVVRGRKVEISLMGGLASLRLGHPVDHSLTAGSSGNGMRRLEDPQTVNIRELTRLAQMYEDNLITREEFDRAKASLLQPYHAHVQ